MHHPCDVIDLNAAICDVSRTRIWDHHNMFLHDPFLFAEVILFDAAINHFGKCKFQRRDDDVRFSPEV